MGVWIETEESNHPKHQGDVTPCMGVWIETVDTSTGQVDASSHPVWVCGLKPILRYRNA